MIEWIASLPFAPDNTTTDESDQAVELRWTERRVLCRINTLNQIAIVCWDPARRIRRSFYAHEQEQARALLIHLCHNDSIVIWIS